MSAVAAYLADFGPHMLPVTDPAGTPAPPNPPYQHIDPTDMGKAPGIRGRDGNWYPKGVPSLVCTSLDMAREWERWNANVGLALGRAAKLAGIDCDFDDPDLANAVYPILHDRFPVSRGVSTPGHNRRLFPVRLTDQMPRGTTLVFTKNGQTTKIDILGEGKQFVAFGTHRSGGSYCWNADLLRGMDGVEQFPECSLEEFQEALRKVEEALLALGWVRDTGTVSGAAGGASQQSRRTCSEQELSRWLALLPNTDADTQFDAHDRWVGMCAAIKAASENAAWGRDLWLQWCEQRAQKPGEPERVWDTMRDEDVRVSGLDWIRERARERNARLAAQLDFEFAPPLDDVLVAQIAADADGASLWDACLPRFVWVVAQDTFFDMQQGIRISVRSLDLAMSHCAARLSREKFPRKDPPYKKFSEMFGLLPEATKATDFTYHPGQPRLVAGVNGVLNVNRWRAPVLPKGPVADSEVQPWLDHVRMICGGDAFTTTTLLKYFALVAKRPDVKPNFAPLIMSEPGRGKDIMLLPVKHAVGEQNHREVTADQLSNQWTDFLEHRLLYVSETRQHSRGGKSSHDVMNDMKSYLSDQPAMVGVNRKNQSVYQVPNLSAWVFFSNEARPLYIAAGDRRIWVIDSREVPAQPAAYYDKLIPWLEKNRDKIARWLLDYPLTTTDIQFFKGRAPDTRAKQLLINANRDPVESAISEIIEDARTGSGSVGMVCVIPDVDAELKLRAPRPPSFNQIASLLRQAGARPVHEKPDGSAGGVWCSDGKNRRLWLLASTDDAGRDWGKLTQAELAKAYLERKWPSTVKSTSSGSVIRAVEDGDDVV